MLKLLPSKKKYCVFDIGTEKLVCLFFRIQDGKPFILGMDHQKSIGFLNGDKIDKEKLSATIAQTLKKGLPKNTKIFDYEYFSNITDINSVTRKNFTEIDTGKFGITKKDVRRIFKKSIIESRVKAKHLIHSYPINFRIDNKKVVNDPIDQKCEKMGISSFNIYIGSKLFQSVSECFKNEKINIKNFFDSGVASAVANLNYKEKKEGVACIDLGSKTSKVVVFINDKIVYTKVIPVGGEHVTADISKGLDISRESSEHTKILYGTLSAQFNEKITVNSKFFKNKLISRNLLFGIIKPRYEEIFEILRDNIFDDLYARVSIKSLVITGGASKIYGITNISESIFNRKVRVGSVSNKQSFFYNKPEFSTLLGLIKLAQESKNYEYSNKLIQNNFFTAFDKLENWIEESYA